MKPASTIDSPIVSCFEQLKPILPRLDVEFGERPGEPGWINGPELKNAAAGPFHDLLHRFGQALKTSDRRTIAAAFALRYGWSAAVAIAPYIVQSCVPDIGLENIALKFGGDHVFFEKAALLRAEGVALARAEVPVHSSIHLLHDKEELQAWLRHSLIAQATPVVASLHRWSCFSIKGLWGLVTSSWGNQFISIHGRIGEQKNGLAPALSFFAGNDVVARMQPAFQPVSYKDQTHVYHRAASCCRFYLRPKKQYCAMCPLISREERIQRNLDWMKRQIDAIATAD